MEKKTTLVVVDFQYDFCLLGAPLYVPGSDKALWNISHLIENKKVDRVIFTADWHPANHCSFKRNGGEWNDHCVQFSKGAAIHDLLLYGCIGAGIPYEVLTKGALPSSEEYGVKVAPNDTPGFVLSHQDTVLGSDCVYLKGEWIADPLDFLNVEQPKSYFY